VIELVEVLPQFRDERSMLAGYIYDTGERRTVGGSEQKLLRRLSAFEPKKFNGVDGMKAWRRGSDGATVIETWRPVEELP
jgi:hypothetical protein